MRIGEIKMSEYTITNIKRFIDDDGTVQGERIGGYINGDTLHIQEFNDNYVSSADMSTLNVEQIETLIFELNIIKDKLKGNRS